MFSTIDFGKLFLLLTLFLTVIVVDDDVVVGTPVVTVAAAPEGVAEDEGVEGRGEVVIISEERGTL